MFSDGLFFRVMKSWLCMVKSEGFHVVFNFLLSMFPKKQITYSACLYFQEREIKRQQAAMLKEQIRMKQVRIKSLILYYIIPTFDDPEKEALCKHCGKRRKCWNQHFLLFPQCFLPFQEQI